MNYFFKMCGKVGTSVKILLTTVAIIHFTFCCLVWAGLGELTFDLVSYSSGKMRQQTKLITKVFVTTVAETV